MHAPRRTTLSAISRRTSKEGPGGHFKRPPELRIKEAPQPVNQPDAGLFVFFGNGAGRGNRTLMVSLPPDFESAASASFAIPATGGSIRIISRVMQAKKGARNSPGPPYLRTSADKIGDYPRHALGFNKVGYCTIFASHQKISCAFARKASWRCFQSGRQHSTALQKSGPWLGCFRCMSSCTST